MKKRLLKEEKEALRSKFGENPLYNIIYILSKPYERKMSTFRLMPEEVFQETLAILDTLLSEPERAALHCGVLWDELFCDFRSAGISPDTSADMAGTKVPDEELHTGVCVVMSMVVTCLILIGRNPYIAMSHGILSSMDEAHKAQWHPIHFSIINKLSQQNIGALAAWLHDYAESAELLTDKEGLLLLEEEETEATAGAVVPGDYRIAKKQKTNLAKLISAMFDHRMFEDEHGHIATNKVDVIEKVGAFFGVKYTNILQLLNGAKQKKNYIEIFNELKKIAQDFDLR